MNNGSIHFSILQASGRLTPFINDLEKIISCAIKKTQEKVPVGKADIVLYDNPTEAISEVGVGGRTHNSYVVTIAMDPGCTDVTKVIAEKLPRCISHELHHVARWKRVGYGKTLREAVISEGLATHFTQEVWRGEPDPWAVALKGKELKEVLQRAKIESCNEQYDSARWFFGRGDLPRWAGYSLGYHLVAQYLATHPHEKPSTLFDTSAAVFIDSLSRSRH